MVLLGLWILLGVIGMTQLHASENQRPHVLVVMLDEASLNSSDLSDSAGSSGKVVEGLKKLAGGEVDRGTCRFVLGRAGNLVGFLYGRHPMLCGVVSDWDWRRKPVPMAAEESVADKFQKAGYQTVYWGEWGLGAVSNYRPKARGFDLAVISPRGKSVGDALTDLLASPFQKKGGIRKQIKELYQQKEPVFLMLREGRYLTKVKILEVLSEIKSLSVNRPMLVLVMRLKPDQVDQDGYFQNGEWRMMPLGKVPRYAEVLQEMKMSRNVWGGTRAVEMLLGNSALLNPLNSPSQPKPSKPEYEIYHRAGWSLKETPEKFRYRGAMIRRDRNVLIDGLKLYRADESGRFDLSQPLDLAENAKVHQELLMAYGKWWAKVYPAVRNPRSFAVGGKDYGKLRLTALDWRASKIILKNGTSPSSLPPKSMRGLRSKMSALLSDEAYRESFPSYSGSWSVRITRPGRYKITASLLPLEDGGRRLEKGTAHVRMGTRESKLRLEEGSSSISVLMDADAGVQDLECWFTGQLALERVLGAFFVSIERVGDKKLDLDLLDLKVKSKVKPNRKKRPLIRDIREGSQRR